MKYYLFIVSVFLCLCSRSFSQGYVHDASTKAKNNSAYALFPFAGGLNNPQLHDVDLNLDGTKDLFIFDRSGNKVLTFINNGTSGIVDYEYAPEYQSIFPAMENFAVLEDYNCDGVEDIFTSFNNGIRVYEADTSDGILNYGISIEQLQFSEASLLFDLGVGDIDIPGFADVNFDGDLDVLSFRLAGGYVDYYENMQVENGDDCGVIDLEHLNSCWGNFYESGLYKSVDLDISCKGISSGSDLRHAGSTFMCFDEEADGDLDIVLGDLSFQNLNRLTNGGDALFADIVSQDTTFPDYDVPVDIATFPAGFLLDVNNDSRPDMISAPNKDGFSENFRNVWYYKNVSTDATYQFAFQMDSFLVHDMIDVGEGALPAFFDHNEDGLIDIVIGNYGYFDDGNFNGSLALFENTGTLTSPEFTLITRDLGNISAYGLNAMAPAFYDMDNDGDVDMLIGEEEGFLQYFPNIAEPGEDAQFGTIIANYQGIDPGKNSTPQLIDVNEDGLVDLIVGEQNGNLNYYENNGTEDEPVFTLMSEFWGEVDVRAPLNLTGYSVPYLMQTSVSEWELYVGCKEGTIYLYQPTTDFTGAFTQVTSSFSGIDDGKFSSVQLMDLNGDSARELMTGNYRGGITLYKFSTEVAITDTLESDFDLQVYPNPGHDLVYFDISQNDHVPAKYQLLIYDVAGRSLGGMEISIGQAAELDISHFPAGVYLIKCFDFNHQLIQTESLIRM